jgi:2-keto-4-pentenoate hydratase/2-oxohepta-3-ene-1,7-dioic acid hydratase in catechol pathway
MKLLNFFANDGAIHLGYVQGAFVVDLTEMFPRENSFRSVARWLRASEEVRKLTGESLQQACAGRSPELALEHLNLAPLVDPDCRIFCVGLNYTDHAAENRLVPPESPIFFAKLVSTVTPHGKPIPLPRGSAQVDYEAELAFVVGRRAQRLSENAARSSIAGYTIMNDVTARDLQMRDGQWFRGKNCDGFAPLGPWLITSDEVTDPDGLEITLRLNGEERQHSNTRNLFFKPPKLLSFLSQTLTLEPGDVISTGTPAGVGYHRKPQVFLQPGDVVEIEIAGIGTLRNPVAACAV